MEQKKKQVGHTEEKTKKVLVCEVSGNVVKYGDSHKHYQGCLFGLKKVRDRRPDHDGWTSGTRTAVAPPDEGEKEAAGKESGSAFV